MGKLTKIEQDTLNKFNKFYLNNNISNEFLVQLIELAGNYLNLMTISDYAKENKLSYNGVKNNRNIIIMFNVKFVIDND